MQVVLKDSCYLAQITRYRRWFNKSSSEMTGRVRRRPCAPPSLRDFVRWRSDISRRLRRGGANRKKKISVQVNLTLIFFFRFAERRRFELLIPFWSIHAFQACLLSHSSISPELPCNTDRVANIRIIC